MSNMKNMKSRQEVSMPHLAFHPGEHLRDELEERGITQTEFAQIIDEPLRTVNELCKEKRSITPELAQSIGAAIGNTPDFWLRLQADYDAYLLSKKEQKKVDEVKERSELYARYPIAELIKRKYLPNKKTVLDIKKAIEDLLGEGVEDNLSGMQVCLRASSCGTVVESYLATWVQLGKRLAEKIKKTPSYSSEDLQRFAQEIKRYSIDTDGVQKVLAKLNSLGVRVVILPHFSKTRVDGAATWISEREPVIIMSLRYDRIDNFYFTLLHEIGHILLHPNKDFHDEINNLGAQKEEQEANEFAVRVLGVGEVLSMTNVVLRPSSLLHISGEIGVHPGILVGFLQHKGILGYNQFRRALVKVKSDLPKEIMYA